MVQWLRIHASTAGGIGLIPGWVTRFPKLSCATKKEKIPLYIEYLFLQKNLKSSKRVMALLHLRPSRKNSQSLAGMEERKSS